MWKERGNIVVYALIAVLAVLSLLVLFRLRERFERNLTDRVNDLQRVFSSRSLLKSPADNKIAFYQIEAEAAKYENRGDFGSIWIAKNFGTEHRVVYPFYYPALKSAGTLKAPIAARAGDKSSPLLDRLFPAEKILKRSLQADGQVLGTLYVQVNEGAFRTVSLVIWALGAMLATSLAFLASQFRRQEKVISATTIELEEKRRELVRLERLALAGQLSANILHDLKKPVLNIRNEADEALHPIDSNHEAESSESIFSRIREQADFFISMLKEAGFDRFVRAREEREYVDLNELLDRSLALVKYEQASVEVHRDYTVDLPAILADPIRIIQVFSNLALNAYQAMQGRGELHVVTKQKDDLIYIEISDNGPGMPDELKQHIFEPFYTTKPPGQGTGLGLYIVREIVQDLNGSITVDSEPGCTRFTVTFATEP